MVMVLMTVGDQGEDRLHQIEGVDPTNHHQHLVNVVWRSLLVVVMRVIYAADVIRVQMQT